MSTGGGAVRPPSSQHTGKLGEGQDAVGQMFLQYLNISGFLGLGTRKISQSGQYCLA